ncbi:MAG: acyltransferase family protein [Gammaproteobacteria bacterium]
MTPRSEGAKQLHPKYRPDIDGLRALAVTAVVVFHAFPNSIPGGFLGVDIFFVISGYLISTILFSNLESGRFSLLDFYNRRIRRIFPALITVMLASLAIGWVVLLAGEYDQLGQHIAAGSVFLSNLVLYRESGYFDTAAAAKPMLHLWSLAVEEQFYVLWPLLLLVVWRRRWSFLRLTAVVAAVSFAANLYLVSTKPTAAFYLPMARFWELMIGGMLAYATLHRRDLLGRFTNLQSVAGLLLMVAGFAFVTETTAIPGWWALLPTLGAALTISAGAEAILNRLLFSNRVAVWIGLVSYPIYLWHWPLLSILRIVIPQASTTLALFAVVATVLLAWLTYRFIEKPIRRHPSNAAVPILLAASMACLFLGGFAVHANQGLRFRAAVQANRDPAAGEDGRFATAVITPNCDRTVEEAGLRKATAYCARDTRDPIRFAVIGDSKAGALFPGLVRTSTDAGRWEIVSGNATDGAPIPVLSDQDIYEQHQRLAHATLKTLAQSKEIETVIFAVAARTLFHLATDYDINGLPGSPWYESAYEGINRATAELTGSGKKIVLLVDNPTLPYPQHCWERRTGSALLDKVLRLEERNRPCVLKLHEYYKLSKQYRDLLVAVQRTNAEKIFIFDMLPYLCDSSRNECRTFRDERPLYGNTDHISDYAAGMVATDLNRFVLSLR